MERNPDNRCEIQYVCDGRSKVMIRLKLVKGSVDNKLLANEDPGGLNGTRVMKQLDGGIVEEWYVQTLMLIPCFML